MVQGQKVVNGSLVDVAGPRPSHKTAPLIRPKKDAIPLQVETSSSKMFSSGLRRHPPSPNKNKLKLEPQGDFNGGDLNLLDPKSADWGKTINIADIQRKMKEQLNEPVSATHQKPSFGIYAARKDTTQSDRLKVSADQQVKLLTKMLDEAGDTDIDVNETLEVKGLKPLLLPHQVAGVKFMLKREQTGSKSGGFLFDEMGLGKTVQSIALILANRPDKEAEGPKTTLIALPLSLLDQWKEEIEQKATGIKVMKYHGTKRVANFGEYDVILTTYSLISNEFNENGKSGPLITTPWYRVIADEAHTFRNPESRTSKAMAALKSSGRRWALTGTPVHNSVEDLYSLFRYVDLKPHSDRGIWDRDIGRKSSTKGPNSQATKILKTYLSASMIRRKQDILDKVLPPVKREILKVPLNMKEQTLYQKVLKPSYCKGVTRITAMRLACDGLTIASKTEEDLVEDLGQAVESITLETKSGDSQDDIDDLTEFMSKTSLGTDDKSAEAENCKVGALRKILKTNPGPKTVVFTSFVKFFNQVTDMLDAIGMDYLPYHGSQNIVQREQTLKSFREDPSKKVLLCSLQCAAVGLNIVCASRVVLMEPWWNPMIVDQAVNRVHRLGQTKPVDVYELCATGTLEDRMFLIQDRKRKLASNFVEGGQKLSKQEIEYLIWGGKIPDSLGGKLV